MGMLQVLEMPVEVGSVWPDVPVGILYAPLVHVPASNTFTK